METSPRRRGRPAGSTRYLEADVRLLHRVADKLVETPDIPFSTMVRRVLGNQCSESHLRRLQRRWRHQGQDLLAQAARRLQARLEQRPLTLGQILSPEAAQTLTGIAQAMQPLHTAMKHGRPPAALLDAANRLQAAQEQIRKSFPRETLNDMAEKLQAGMLTTVNSPGFKALMESFSGMQDQIRMVALAMDAIQQAGHPVRRLSRGE